MNNRERPDRYEEGIAACPPAMRKDKMRGGEECDVEPLGEADGRPEMRCFPDCILLAHAYVPWQVYNQAFCPREALMKGTLFPELFGVYPIPQ